MQYKSKALFASHHYRSSSRALHLYLSTLLLSLLLSVTSIQTGAAQQVTGLQGWSLFLDPGHSQRENMGLYNYSEAEKVLQVGLELREMLLSQTDIDTVYMSRTNGSQSVSLKQRTDLANSLAADFFHSIHSNAGPASTNNTLMLHGGWRSGGVTVEKTPTGGKRMGDHMIEDLTAAMRIPTIGNYADRNFYQGSSITNHTNQWPYLHVNRESNMASVLSEAGFHTSPLQQKRNINAHWKRLEAQSHFWSVLAYMGAERPQVDIVTGIISDKDGGAPLNGALVQIGESSYTTDDWETVFSRHSTDPKELSNGFYYIEGVDETTVQVTVSAAGYYPDTVQAQLKSDDFTFVDVSLVSSVPPTIAQVSIAQGASLNIGEPLILTFSRAMDRTSVEGALTLEPSAGTLSLGWISDRQLRIASTSLAFLTDYTLRLSASAKDGSTYGHGFDGDGDGQAGGDFVLAFKTSPADILPPVSSGIFPVNDRLHDLDPLGSVAFNELLEPTSIDSSTIYYFRSGVRTPGRVEYYEVGTRSVINYFPALELESNRNYLLSISGKLADRAGNALGANIVRSFSTGTRTVVSMQNIDDFDNDLGAWWQPSESGSTIGYVAEQTLRERDSERVNHLTGSEGSVKLTYGWNPSAAEHLLRLYRKSTTPKFSSDRVLQAFVFGDGSGNPFRFMLRDGNGQLEGSRWIPIDWIGWKLISWDLKTEPATGWVNGNGTLDGQLHLDSFQLSFTQGGATSGTLYIDDLRVVTFGTPVSTDDLAEGGTRESEVPSAFVLEQNHPNPFNPATTIRFGLQQTGRVDLRVFDLLGREVAQLAEGRFSAGWHEVRFEAGELPSGMYLYRLVTEYGTDVKRLTLVK